MATCSVQTNHARHAKGGAFTLVEVVVGMTLGVFILSGVLSANLQVLKAGARISNYVEMESQLRRGLDYLGRDLRDCLAFTWNSATDLTLTIPLDALNNQDVTYAWSSTSKIFYRVAGRDSSVTTGRLELIRGITSLAFSRFTMVGTTAATTDYSTQRVVVTLTISRTTTTTANANRSNISATFTLRNKAVL